MVGSQLVGLVPLQALLDAAAFYCDKENLFVLEEEHRVRLVSPLPGWGRATWDSMGLVPGALLLGAPTPRGPRGAPRPFPTLHPRLVLRGQGCSADAVEVSLTCLRPRLLLWGRASLPVPGLPPGRVAVYHGWPL